MLRKILYNQFFLLMLSFLVVALLVRLGFWQIHRAENKRSIMMAQQKFMQQKGRKLKPHQLPKAYERIVLSGHYGKKLIFLDNQHWKHRFGYHVLSPFYVDNGSVVMVNRGWVAGDVSRRLVPKIFTPLGKLRIEGQAWYPTFRSWSIGPESERKGETVVIVEQAKPVLMERFLNRSLAPFMLRLSTNQAEGFVREWPEQRMTPERHYGYALQWFGLALTFGIITLILWFRNKHEDN